MDRDFTEKIYPRLEPSVPPVKENEYIEITNNNDMMNRINKIKQDLEDCADKRSALSKKYSKVLNGLHYTNYGLDFISVSAGAATVATVPAIFLGSLSTALGGVLLGAGLLGIAVNKLSKKLKRKENKHREIYNLCKAKLSTVESLLNKALKDGCISADEFQLILNDESNFRDIKESIRRKKNKAFNEEGMKEKGRNEVRDAVKKSNRKKAINI